MLQPGVFNFKTLIMKKVILSNLIAAFVCPGICSYAQTGVTHGYSETVTYPNGSRTTCDSNPDAICTTNTSNPNGTFTVVVYHYDKAHNLTGTSHFVTKSSDEAHEPDPDGGYVNAIQTTQGMLYGKLTD